MARQRKRTVKKVYSTGAVIREMTETVEVYKPLSQSVGVMKVRRAARATQTISSLVKPTEQFMSKVNQE